MVYQSTMYQLPPIELMCVVASIVYGYFLIKFKAVFCSPVTVVTVCPGQGTSEGGEEIAECPGHDDVVVAVEEKYYDQCW